MAESGLKEDLSRSVPGASEEETELYCDPCEHDGNNVAAEGFCMDCQEYLCSACYKVHCRPAVWRHHRLQNEQSMPIVKPATTVKDVCTEKCQTHNNIIEYFCNSHEHFGCLSCITTQHQACERVDFIPESAAIFGSSKELKELQLKLSELLMMNETNKSELSKKLKAVELQAERAKLQIKHLRAIITDLFDKLEEKIDESIEDLKSGDEKKITDLANETDEISETLQKHITGIESCLNEKKICQLFMKAKRIKDPLNDLTEQVANIGDFGNIQRYQFTPDQIIVDMVTEIEEIGVLDIMDQHAKVPKFERDINVRTETDECECEISGIALLSEQLLVVVDSENKYVKLIDMVNNSVKSSYISPSGSYPLDVAKVDVAQIAVTYPCSEEILFLDVLTSGSIKMQREINASGECIGIECMEDNLIVSFNNPPGVKILTMTGDVARAIKLGRNMNYTDYLAVNQLKNLIYVSNWGSGKSGSVICLTNDGERNAVFEDERLNGPHGASVDTHGVVYVCGRFSHNVVQLSEDCSMIQELLNIDDGLTDTLCLALSLKNDELYIGRKCDEIKVFKLY